MSLLSKEEIDIILSYVPKDEESEVLLSDNENSKQIKGFLSESNKLSIKYNNRGKTEEINLFLKKIPEASFHRELIEGIGAFEREAGIYNNFLNQFVTLIKSASFPKCYLARSNDLIVLEDLSYQGFKTISINEAYDLQHCKKVIESICNLHAASIAYEIRNSCKLTHVMPSLQTSAVINLETEHDKKFYFVGIKSLRALIKTYLNSYSGEIIEKAFKYFEVMPNELRPSESCINVLTHGDVWGNNIMFKYGDNNEVSKAYLIDFQLSTYTTPAFDLLMLLHNCTTSEFRKQHYSYLIRYYYSYLLNLLSTVKIDLGSIMPWSNFEETVNETIPKMLAISNIVVPFALMPEDILREILPYNDKFRSYLEEDRDSYVLEAAKRSSIYRSRVLDTITSFLDIFNK